VSVTSVTREASSSGRAAASVELDDACLDAQLGPVSLRVAAGERVALVGRNGSGKSTLLRLIAGLAKPTRGRVRVTCVKGALGYVPQAFRASLLPWLSVRDNVALPLRGEPLTAGERVARVDEALAAVPLDRALLTRRPQTLSGGEQQLVALARALVARPSLLLLDEPFSALDAVARRAMRAALGAWLGAARAGASLLIVSHDLDDLALAERALVFAGRPGRVVADVPAARARDEIARLASLTPLSPVTPLTTDAEAHDAAAP
jgi:ABC-type nitrate/sulfonate/bicarbonate transport system ATPase subunit